MPVHYEGRLTRVVFASAHLLPIDSFLISCSSVVGLELVAIGKTTHMKECILDESN